MSPGPAAFQVLQSPEVLKEICLQLAPGELDTEAPYKLRTRRWLRRKTLAHLARVCRAFSDPALDVLWEVVEDVMPILSILPPFEFLADETYALSRDLTQPEWDRFQRYVQRVHTLSMSVFAPSELEMISPSVWTFLARWCPPGQGLLPRLRSLRWLTLTDPEPGCVLLLSPSLRHLYIHKQIDTSENAPKLWPNELIVEFAQMTVYPQLESLHVDATRFLNDFPAPKISTLSPRLTHLQELVVDDRIFVNALFFTTLATFRNLRKLKFWMRVFLPKNFSVSPGSFNELRHLDLSADPLALDRFLKITSPQHLETLTVHVLDWFRCTDDEAITHIHSVLSHMSFCTRKLSITLEQEGPRVPALLAPALAFWRLTHVEIILEEYIPELIVSNTELRAFADAWPHLVEFTLALKDTARPDDILTFPDPPVPRTLVYFAERHPQLVSLTLPFVSVGQIRDGILEGLDAISAGRPHRLKYLRVCVVDIVDDGMDAPMVRAFAIFVDRLFPHLDYTKTKTTEWVAHGDNTTDWHEIEAILTAMHAARGDARTIARRLLKGN
ncbi:hypothetical protein C2E23DRAFT_453452 [Lenzites betulinus]|nr:hypothetical protein C2E23DRAFT_453452 [Lenzites betulinus]